jgi:hypothetical protein
LAANVQPGRKPLENRAIRCQVGHSVPRMFDFANGRWRVPRRALVSASTARQWPSLVARTRADQRPCGAMTG